MVLKAARHIRSRTWQLRQLACKRTNCAKPLARAADEGVLVIFLQQDQTNCAALHCCRVQNDKKQQQQRYKKQQQQKKHTLQSLEEATSTYINERERGLCPVGSTKAKSRAIYGRTQCGSSASASLIIHPHFVINCSQLITTNAKYRQQLQ